MKYRIIKETKEKTKDVKYCIEIQYRFLCLKWWIRVKRYHPLYGSEEATFNTEKGVRDFYDKRTQKTIIEIIKL
jgi:hypothetical protein